MVANGCIKNPSFNTALYIGLTELPTTPELTPEIAKLHP